MRNITTIVLALGLATAPVSLPSDSATALLAPFIGASSAEAAKCRPTVRVKCPVNPAPGVQYRGTKVVKTITVTICHRRWNDLRGGPGQRWWGLAYLYRSGVRENIKEIRSQCTTRDVVAGTKAGNAHDCDSPGRLKWFYSNPMTVAGATYWVG